MFKIHHLYLFILLTISRITSAVNVNLQVKGLYGELKKNVCAQLSIIKRDEVILDQQYQLLIENVIRKSLKALGYYEPTINFNLCPPPTRGRQILITHISPGKPILISGINVVLRGAARMDQEYLDLLATCPKVGDVLNHGDYDHFKKNLAGIALRKGYFDSKFTKSQLGISVKKYQAFWDIEFNSGERYRFGNVIFEGSQINDKYLKNLIPFKKGDYYQSSDLIELNRRLLATGWFKSILLPEFNKARKIKVLPMYSVVSPHTENTIETGIGYSTDVGSRIKIMWKKPWINSYGHSLTAVSNISMPEQQLDFRYKIPLIKNPLEQYYLLQGEFKHTNFNGAAQNSTMLLLSRYWDFSQGWQKATNLRWSLDHFNQANVNNVIMLFYPSLVISRTRSQGGLMPIRGNSQRYSIDYSSSAWGSDISFYIMQAQNVWMYTVYNKHRFVMRSNIGWIETNDFTRIPPDLRFFAGGDRSIRGYKHKSVSPENQNGYLTGASKIATGSLEYQYNISNKWWGAMFIDSGEAVNNIRKSDFKTGAGIGVRWQSPVGAIKLDFAMPVNDKRDRHSLQFYIGLGPEL